MHTYTYIQWDVVSCRLYWYKWHIHDKLTEEFQVYIHTYKTTYTWLTIHRRRSLTSVCCKSLMVTRERRRSAKHTYIHTYKKSYNPQVSLADACMLQEPYGDPWVKEECRLPWLRRARIIPQLKPWYLWWYARRAARCECMHIYIHTHTHIEAIMLVVIRPSWSALWMYVDIYIYIYIYI